MNNYSWNFCLKYYKNFGNEICNYFKEHVENISGYGNTVKIYKNFKPFEKYLGKLAANKDKFS